HVMQSLVLTPRHGFGHLLHVAPTTLEQAMKIEACSALNRAGETLEAGKIWCEVGIEMRERGCDQRGYAIGVFELTS
ncbi:MAG: hypothetical protein Q8O38_07565, partial [Sulfurimicrobium sp.]|nr:hypothetical protein [Sulfurimicrobium sp.]